MKFEDFTKEQRAIIGEFVYSYDNDILIKPDALDLVDVFIEKDFIDEEEAIILRDKINNNIPCLEEMIEILFTSVEEEEGKKIMKEYFGN